MMARIIDITDKIENEDVVLKIGEKEYKLNNSKNAVLKILALWRSVNDEGGDKVAAMEQTLAIAVGEEAAHDFDEYSFEAYGKILPYIMAAITGKTPEEYEASFRTEETA